MSRDGFRDVLEVNGPTKQVIEHDQGLTAQDDEGFPDGSPLWTVVCEGLGEATRVALEGHSHEIEDVAEQGAAPFGEVAAALEADGRAARWGPMPRIAVRMSQAWG